MDLQDGIDAAELALRMGRYEHATVVLQRTQVEAGRALESDLSEPDSDASSQPAEPADSDAGSVPDEEMLAEPDEPMPDPQVPRAAP